MSTLAEIETAIQRLSPDERAELACWWQQTFDPDEGLELQDHVARELDAAQREIARGEVADWQQMKQAAKATAR
jgi:alkylhydroperoxidase family enzyme